MCRARETCVRATPPKRPGPEWCRATGYRADRRRPDNLSSLRRPDDPPPSRRRPIASCGPDVPISAILRRQFVTMSATTRPNAFRLPPTVAAVGCVLLARSRLNRVRRQRRGHPATTIRPPARRPLDSPLVTRDGHLREADVPNPHSGGSVQSRFAEVLARRRQGHQHANRSHDLGKPLLIMRCSA